MGHAVTYEIQSSREHERVLLPDMKMTTPGGPNELSTTYGYFRNSETLESPVTSLTQKEGSYEETHSCMRRWGIYRRTSREAFEKRGVLGVGRRSKAERVLAQPG
jgi:hypothetical protein